MKKIVQIILIILIIATIGVIVWDLFFRSEPEELSVEQINQEQAANQEQAVSSANIRVLEGQDREVIDLTNSGKIISLSSSGSLTVIDPIEKTEQELSSDALFREALSMQARTTSSILIETTQPSGKSQQILINGAWLELSDEVSSASLSPTGENIALFYEGSATLETINYQTQEVISVYSLNLIDIDIEWVNESTILIQSKPSQETEGFLLSFNLETGELFKLSEAFGLSSISSKTLDHSLILQSTKLEPSSLLLVQGSGQTSPLSFSTMPGKCTFSSNNALYCAVPNNQEKTKDFPDSYLQRSTFSEDNIIEITINNGSIRSNAILDSSSFAAAIDAKNLNKVGQYLYFINRYDNQLYELKLEE